MARPKVSYQHCDRCGKRIKTWLYSPWTKHRYCTDIDACSRRAKKRQRQQQREVVAA